MFIKKIIATVGISISSLTFSQVGVGTTSPDPSSILELSSNNKGFLPSRVALLSSDDGITIPNPATGLIVFNTNTGFSDEGLYLNAGTPSAPNWKMLQMQIAGGTQIEYSELFISPLVNLNTVPNNSGLWREVPDLKQNVIVSPGSVIKTVVTAILAAQSSNGVFAQCDILVKITPGATPLPSTLPFSSNPRDSFGLLIGNGNGQSTSINIAKSEVATVSNYIIQVYINRNNSPTNSTYYYLSPFYINTLATKF